VDEITLPISVLSEFMSSPSIAVSSLSQQQSAQDGFQSLGSSTIMQQCALMQTSIILDNNVAGTLRRQAKTGRSIGLRRNRFYRLDGAIMSKHMSETSTATWHANILGAVITQLRRVTFSIKLKDTSSGKGQDARIVFCVKSEDQCRRWVACLHSAARRLLEGYYKIGQVIGEGEH
jgi:hypothetical protein